MLVKIAVVLVVLVGALLAFGATRPATFTVSRSLEMDVRPSVPYALVQDFHRWAAWSPWDKLDPDQKRTFGGAAAGQGAEFAWASDKVGAGHMTITSVVPDAQIDVALEFLKPFRASNEVRFLFEPQGTAGTRVTWRMQGHRNFVMKVLSIFMDMDKMVGPDFERGLANMKTEAEKAGRGAVN